MSRLTLANFPGDINPVSILDFNNNALSGDKESASFPTFVEKLKTLWNPVLKVNDVSNGSIIENDTIMPQRKYNVLLSVNFILSFNTTNSELSFILRNIF